MKKLYIKWNWDYYRAFLSIIGGIIALIGFFGTWLWHRELNKNIVYEISPLYTKIIDNGVLLYTYWFYNFNISFSLSLSAIGLLIGVFVYLISCNRLKINVIGSIVFFISFLLFFFSFGEGLEIGVRTKIGWGLQVTIVGGIIMFFSTFINILTNYIDL